LYGGASLDLR
jgi:hypothetical protein